MVDDIFDMVFDDVERVGTFSFFSLTIFVLYYNNLIVMKNKKINILLPF